MIKMITQKIIGIRNNGVYYEAETENIAETKNIGNYNKHDYTMYKVDDYLTIK